MCARHFVLVFIYIVGVSLIATSSARAQDCMDPIPGLYDCVRDADCIYVQRDRTTPCCDCDASGNEAAINKNKKGELDAHNEMCCINPGCLLFLNCNYPEETVRCLDGTCSLGTCGDSKTVSTGEQCDDGGESAACDADCTNAECGDWTINGTAGETCDDGNTVDGDGCSSACACTDATDADGDGVGDACDDCVNSAGDASLASLAFKYVGLDPTVGNDGLRLKMEFTSAAPFASLDPVADGMRLLVKDEAGRPLVDLALPGGAFDGIAGWKTSGAATGFLYIDKNDPPAVNGVSKARVGDRSSKAPGLVSVQIKGRDATYAVGAYDVPLQAVVAIGAAAGHCGQVAYQRERCKVSATGTGISCR